MCHIRIYARRWRCRAAVAADAVAAASDAAASNAVTPLPQDAARDHKVSPCLCCERSHSLSMMLPRSPLGNTCVRLQRSAVLTQCACAFLLQGLDFYAESAGVAVWCGSPRSSWVVLMYTRALDRRCSCVHALWSEGLSCFLCCGPKFRYLNTLVGSIIIFCFSCARLCWFEVLSTHPQRTRRVGVCTRVIIACRVCNYVVSSRD